MSTPNTFRWKAAPRPSLLIAQSHHQQVRLRLGAAQYARPPSAIDAHERTDLQSTGFRPTVPAILPNA